MSFLYPFGLMNRLRTLAVGILSAGAITAVLLAQTPKPAPDAAKSEAAFLQLVTVLRNPRCMNCHTATDFPREGNERRRHNQMVMRGPEDDGVPAMRCSTCHQNINQENGVPGAPNWKLAPLSMAWENLDDHQLAEMLIDPARNGQRSLDSLYDHMAHDELVGWAWNPGGKRDAPPLSRAEFARLVREWIDNGAKAPKAR
jgi:hypothetical protein